MLFILIKFKKKKEKEKKMWQEIKKLFGEEF